MGYKIGSFNMRNIGYAALGEDNPRDLKTIASIIRNEKFDVVALQEVLSEGKAFYSHDGFQKTVLMELGLDWDFKWADAEFGSDSRGEGFAFLWNTKRLRLSTTKLLDGSIRTFNPRMYKESREGINRKPFYARFTPEGMAGGSYFEIRLICVHTYYGKDDPSSRAIRKAEMDTLLKNVYPQIADRIYSQNLPSYTILLGDYNMELWRPWKESLPRKSRPAYLPDTVSTDSKWWVDGKEEYERKIVTVQDQFTTLKSKEEEDESKGGNRGYAHDYDHFSYEIDRFDGIKLTAQRIDAVRKYCNDDYTKYKKTISDHVPIVMSIEINNMYGLGDEV